MSKYGRIMMMRWKKRRSHGHMLWTDGMNIVLKKELAELRGNSSSALPDDGDAGARRTVLPSARQHFLQEDAASSFSRCSRLHAAVCHLSHHFHSEPAGHHFHLSLQATTYSHKPAAAFAGRLGLLVFHCLCFFDSLKQPGKFNTCVGECVIVVTYAVGMTDLFFSFIGPLAVIVFLYLRLFVVAVSHARATRSHVGIVTLRSTTIKSSDLKAARTLGVVVVVFMACIMPYFCIAISGQDVMLNASSAAFIICLFYLNSCLNPLIYAIFYPWFRRSIKIIVTLQILKADSSQANIM
ncbi:trace amine-associated receptor 6-like isoform X2 [Hippocampus comes]|uniref:trace amine-associated receptor 6-like isoform X2 n=1 Tax=Hippocampus comes TaxID=109280 RepID=UPI00094E0217|nr:PREDICTED: trace amine-associated receptor 6-like isoform X2 [Hippocampus comes]